MKTMKNFLAALTLVFLVAFSASAQKESKLAEVKIKTSAICKMCKATIERQLAFEKGVTNSNLDVPSKVVTVTYNPKKTDATKIKKAITMSGYDAEEMPADPKAYTNLDPCCKKDSAPHQD